MATSRTTSSMSFYEGQKILKGNYFVLNSSKKPDFFPLTSALLASKKGNF